MSSLDEIFEKITGTDLTKTPELSDTIVYYSFGKPCYVNLATNETSDSFIDIIRKDKKYIVVNWNDFNQHYGHIAKYFPEYDFIVVATYKLTNEGSNFKWQQQYQIAISRYGHWYFNNDGTMISGDESMLYGLAYIIDLCGQFVYPEEKYVSKKESCVFGFNIHGTSSEEIRKFTGGVCFICGCPSFSMEDTTIYDLVFGIENNIVEYGIKENFMMGIRVDKLSLPEHIMYKIKQSVKNCFYKNMANSVIYTNLVSCMKGFRAGYLQDIDGSYVFRTFFVYISGPVNEKGEIPMDIIEESRTNLTSDIISGDMELLSVPLAYFDRSIEDGPFKYCKKQLEKMEESFLLRNADHDCKISMRTVCTMAFIPFFEKIYRFFETKMEKDKTAEYCMKKLIEIAENCKDDIYQSLFNCLGTINYDEDELHKSLGISKALLNMFIYNGDEMFSEIRFIKAILNNYPDYLMNMNRKTAKKIVDAVLMFFEKSLYNSENNSIINLFSKMIDVSGPKNIVPYLEFVLKEYCGKQQIADYMFYIDKLSVIKRAVPDLKADSWKVKLSELEKADEAISKSYNTLNDGNLYFSSLQKFREHHREWAKYEYENSSFIVTYPDGPTELIEEGTKLRHCAKDYIEAVAAGKTTILFIRRKSAPKKPFYTLEVKNGHAIQCHGFGNCNVRECECLMDFIKSFCNNKGIILEGKLDELIGLAI